MKFKGARREEARRLVDDVLNEPIVELPRILGDLPESMYAEVRKASVDRLGRGIPRGAMSSLFRLFDVVGSPPSRVLEDLVSDKSVACESRVAALLELEHVDPQRSIGLVERLEAGGDAGFARAFRLHTVARFIEAGSDDPIAEISSDPSRSPEDRFALVEALRRELGFSAGDVWRDCLDDLPPHLNERVSGTIAVENRKEDQQLIEELAEQGVATLPASPPDPGPWLPVAGRIGSMDDIGSEGVSIEWRNGEHSLELIVFWQQYVPVAGSLRWRPDEHVRVRFDHANGRRWTDVSPEAAAAFAEHMLNTRLTGETGAIARAVDWLAKVPLAGYARVRTGVSEESLRALADAVEFRDLRFATPDFDAVKDAMQESGRDWNELDDVDLLGEEWLTARLRLQTTDEQEALAWRCERLGVTFALTGDSEGARAAFEATHRCTTDYENHPIARRIMRNTWNRVLERDRGRFDLVAEGIFPEVWDAMQQRVRGPVKRTYRALLAEGLSEREALLELCRDYQRFVDEEIEREIEERGEFVEDDDWRDEPT